MEPSMRAQSIFLTIVVLMWGNTPGVFLIVEKNSEKVLVGVCGSVVAICFQGVIIEVEGRL